VLITTGVYKGRKYRTQALHIYGCDEYIEKPIAPEQLLAIVGRFLGSATSAPSARTTVAAATPSSDLDASFEAESDASAQSAPPSVPPTSNVARRKPPKLPTANTENLTDEDEIMARLDAVLSSGNSTTSAVTTSTPVAVVAAAEPFAPLSVEIEVESTYEQDPFAQMQAELNAELGSLAAALALEPAPAFEPMPDPIRSDQPISPSVLETLPPFEVESQRPQQLAAAGIITEAPPGQVVSFDTGRPRKNKKTAKRSKDRAPRVVETPNALESKLPSTVERSPAASEVTLPHGTLVESVLEPAASKRASSAWIWAAAGLAAIVVLYLVFVRDSGTRSNASLVPTASDTAPASESAQTSPTVVEPSGDASQRPELVANTISVPPPARPPTRAAVPAAVPAPVPAPAPAPAPAKTSASPTNTASSGPKVPDHPAPKREPPKPPEPEATAPSGIDEDVVGVESVVNAAAGSVPPSSIAPGTLVSLDEVDAPPVVLSRKLPTYSRIARERRISGTVVMNVLINERGTVDEVVLVTGVVGADVNDSAIRAAKTWTYHPATKTGVPVKVWKTEQLIFKL
jgi:TonB family protein